MELIASESPHFTDLSPRADDPLSTDSGPMKDDTAIRRRLEQLRGQFLQWGTPELQVFVVSKDELRGWIRALVWVLGKTSADLQGP